MLEKLTKKRVLRAQIIAEHSVVKDEEGDGREIEKFVKNAVIQNERPAELRKAESSVKTRK